MATSEGVTGAPSSQALGPHTRQGQRTLVPGTVFGAGVGLLLGGAVGAACCWLAGCYDAFWQGVLVGTLAGPVVGAVLGWLERKVRGDLVRPDIATYLGVVLGLFPALLLVLLGLGNIRGKGSGLALIGGFFVGPMVGLVIGGILDRAFEAALKKAWAAAITFGVSGPVICIALAALFDRLAYGPDPEEVGWSARALLISEWNKDPSWQKTKMEQLSLFRTGRTTYKGFAEVTRAGKRERLLLQAVVEDGMLDMTWVEEPEKRAGGE